MGFKNQKGSALITALFIMTLVAIAATAMMTRLQLDIYRTRLTLTHDKLYLASQAVTFWAMNQLATDTLNFVGQDSSEKISTFPKKLQTMYPGVVIDGYLSDLQAKYNINNLSDKKYQAFFNDLFERINPTSTISERKQIIDDTSRWISSYKPKSEKDDFQAFYLKQKPAIYPSYQFMRHVSELRLLRGMSAERYQALLPYVTALPEATPININTASKTLLMSLGDGLSHSQVTELLKHRGKKGIRMQEIGPLLQKLNIPNQQITLESTYFLSVAHTSIDDANLTVYTLIKRIKDKKGKIQLRVFSQTLNAA